VSFWIDNQTGHKPLEDFVLVESSTTPLYDRKFAIGLNSADGSRNVEGYIESIFVTTSTDPLILLCLHLL
jgi:zinc finger CCHC domain-containing protein 8